jgi:hypothetical protein
MNTPWAIAFGALWVVVLLNAVVTVGVLRRIGNILERTEALMASGTRMTRAPWIFGGGPGVTVTSLRR